MNMSKVVLALGLTVGMVGCGGPSKEDAQVGYALAQGLAVSAAQSIRSHNGLSAAQAGGDIDLSVMCAESGSIEFKGSFSGDTADFSYDFKDCKQGGVSFGGGWEIKGSKSGELTMIGTFEIEAPQVSVSCDFDLKVNAAGVVSGTACGYDVSELQPGT